MTVKIEIYFSDIPKFIDVVNLVGKELVLIALHENIDHETLLCFQVFFLTSEEIFYAEICNTKYSLLFFKLCYLKPNCKWKLIVWKDLKVQYYVLRCFKYLNQISDYCSLSIPFQRFVLQVIQFPSGSWISMEIACILLLYLLLNKIQY